MRIIARRMLKNYWENYKGANQPALESALKAWFLEVRNAEWNNANEIKQQFGSASILKNGRVVFNVCGNNFRLVVSVNFERKIVFTRWVGTHEEYDQIDVEEI